MDKKWRTMNIFRFPPKQKQKNEAFAEHIYRLAIHKFALGANENSFAGCCA